MNRGSFENTKPGDKVIYSGSGLYRNNCKIVKVTRVTKTMVVCKIGNGEVRFRREDGREVGNYNVWHKTDIYPATKENLAEVNIIIEKQIDKVNINILRTFDWSKLPKDKIEKVLKIIDK